MKFHHVTPRVRAACCALLFVVFAGTGAPSGVTFQVRTVTNEVVNDNDGPQSTATVISTVKLIAQGPTLDFFMRTVLHVTVNANGQTTSQVQEISLDCRGRN